MNEAYQPIFPRICIVIPYFGNWPVWIEFFLESCRANPKIDWVFFTDCGKPIDELPSNVKLENIHLQEFLDFVNKKIDIKITWNNPYKICDLRPGLGMVFEDYLRDYQYWGHGDIDVIYGKLTDFLTSEMLDHDCISFSKNHLSGHLCLWRNNELSNSWYQSIPNWKESLENPEYVHFDEPNPGIIPTILKVYAEYSFNTPLSPLTPWVDGTFNYPLEWYWQNGSLTNDLDGKREFPYLHFMHWKGGDWPRMAGNAQWEKLDTIIHCKSGSAKNGFRINETGFHPLLR